MGEVERRVGRFVDEGKRLMAVARDIDVLRERGARKEALEEELIEKETELFESILGSLRPMLPSLSNIELTVDPTFENQTPFFLRGVAIGLMRFGNQATIFIASEKGGLFAWKGVKLHRPKEGEPPAAFRNKKIKRRIDRDSLDTIPPRTILERLAYKEPWGDPVRGFDVVLGNLINLTWNKGVEIVADSRRIYSLERRLGILEKNINRLKEAGPA